MAEVKRINNKLPDYKKNILTQVITDEDDAIPKNLVNYGWMLRRLNVTYENTNEDEYDLFFYSNNNLGVHYKGTKEYIITPDSFTYQGTQYNTYFMGILGSVQSNINNRVKKIILSNSVIGISIFSFESWENLNKITIPNSVTIIENYAFYSCGNLTSITIPNSVTSIGRYAFSECSNLNEINFNGTKAQWNNITLGEYWNYRANISTIHCIDGDITL